MPSYKSHYSLNKQCCFPVWASLQTQAAVYAFVITDTLYKKLWHISDRLIKGKEQPSQDLHSIVILPSASSSSPPHDVISLCFISPPVKPGWEPLIHITNL